MPLASELFKLSANKSKLGSTLFYHPNLFVLRAASLDSVLDLLPTDGMASVEQYLLCTQASNLSSSHRIQGLTVLSTQSLALSILPNGRCALLPLPFAHLQPDSPLKNLDDDNITPQKVIIYLVVPIILL